MDVEIWKQIQKYEGLYEVSNKGNVRSVDRYVNNRVSFRKGKRLKLHENRDYLSVRLNKNGTYKEYQVHRLVANEFVPNPENKKFVNHIDGNKHNNVSYNLEWVTGSENQKHAVRTGLIDYKMLVENSRKGADKISVHILCKNSGEVLKSEIECKQRIHLFTLPTFKYIDHYITHRGKGFEFLKIDDETYELLKQDQKSKEDYDIIYEDVWKQVGSQGRPVKLYCIEQNRYYSSISEAARENNMDKATIQLALKENRSCKGITFVKITSR